MVHIQQQMNNEYNRCMSNCDVLWYMYSDYYYRMAAVTSERGKEKFVDSGFMYVEDKLSVDGTKRFWRYEKRNDGCKVLLHTNARTSLV